MNRRGLVLLGCGKMGSALLAGWLSKGVNPDAVTVIDPAPSDWVKAQGVRIGTSAPSNPAALILAVKPQMMADALVQLPPIEGETLVLSIAAGTSIATLEDILGEGTAIVRSMPNTPAAVGKGISAIVGNNTVTPEQVDLAEALLGAVGDTVRLQTEAQIDAVTGVSGSGPAYVFHLIEALADAGTAQGLSAPVAMKLAKATVIGAAALADNTDETPTQLRENVSSPGGTTLAALKVLMDPEHGFPQLLKDAVKAAANRGRELGS